MPLERVRHQIVGPLAHRFEILSPAVERIQTSGGAHAIDEAAAQRGRIEQSMHRSSHYTAILGARSFEFIGRGTFSLDQPQKRPRVCAAANASAVNLVTANRNTGELLLRVDARGDLFALKTRPHIEQTQSGGGMRARFDFVGVGDFMPEHLVSAAYAHNPAAAPAMTLDVRVPSGAPQPLEVRGGVLRSG